MIYGGYIIQPRVIQESDISVAPPSVREIWAYLLREANSQDNKYNGHVIKRGQLFRSYEDIREGTKWFVGWRKMTYNENATKSAMKFLRDTLRITTTKELGGVMITICKYDYYQDPRNYEATKKHTKETTIEQPIENHPPPDNNKNDKNDKNNKKKEEEVKARTLVFKLAVIEYKSKYPIPMLEAFFNYWSEKNKSNTKLKFELEPTFEISKRLVTWANREPQFNHSGNSGHKVAVAPPPMITYQGE